jgi:hypothetical protein
VDHVNGTKVEGGQPLRKEHSSMTQDLTNALNTPVADLSVDQQKLITANFSQLNAAQKSTYAQFAPR